MAKNETNADKLAGGTPIELSDDELDVITGGYIVQMTHPYFSYTLVDNRDGRVICRDNELLHLRNRAYFLGYDPGIITPEQYKEIFGRDFQ